MDVVRRHVDSPVIEKSRRGNREAQAMLLRSLQDVWFRFCLSLLADRDRAREATQEVAVRVLAGLSRFDGRSSVKTWSLGIALNVVREMRRSQRPSRPIGSAGTMDAAEQAIAAEEQDRLRQVLVDLPERQREAVVMRFFEQMSVAETGKAMGCAAGTVKALVHQALRAMRKQLAEKTTEPTR